MFKRVLTFGIAALSLACCFGSAEAQYRAEPNHALSLDGAGHVAIAHSEALNPTGSFTVEAWVRRNNDSDCGTIVAKGYQSAWWLGLCGQEILFYGAGDGTHQYGNTAVPANVWTHIAVVYRSGQRREYYINGELDHQGTTNDPAPTGNTLPVFIGRDPGTTSISFDGRISNVRFWNVARSQAQIRRNMHVAIEEPLPGLVGNWWLAQDTEDRMGAHPGTLQDNASFSSAFTPPAQPLRAAVDEHFNILPHSRFGAATAYLPASDRALIIGGEVNGGVSSAIDSIDLATGKLTSTGHVLPVSTTQAAAAFVPDTNTVYVFGGASTGSWSGAGVNRIVAIDAATGSDRLLDVTLPEGLSAPAAVFHPDRGRIYLFGGRSSTGPVDGVLVFDPATEKVAPAGDLKLPVASSHLGAAYSSVDGRIYLFGGFGATPSTNVHDQVWAVTLTADGSEGGVISQVADMPGRDALIRVVEDPHTGLLYLLGGWAGYWLWVFDPVEQTVWKTPVAMSSIRSGSSLVLSPVNRHALIIGGDEFKALRNVWRVPLGDGPALPVGDWSFPSPVISEVTAIDGSGRGVAVGTAGNGAYRIRADLALRSFYGPGGLGSASGRINGIRYNPDGDHVWIATDDAGARLRGSTASDYNSDLLGTSRVFSVERNPALSGTAGAPHFGTAGRGAMWQRQVFTGTGMSWQWQRSFDGDSVRAMAVREPGDVWLLSNGNLKHLQMGSLGGTETNYGLPCSLSGARDLAMGKSRDWWIAADAAEFGSGLCRIPAAATPSAPASVAPFCTAIGCLGRTVDVDADGRAWFALASDAYFTGGLAAFETNRQAAGSLHTTEYNWLNAPLGRLAIINRSTTERLWNSATTATGAVDEKIWIGNADGRLVTLSQRWRRIDEANDLHWYGIDRIWLSRGRAFMAGSAGFHVLMPDAATWSSQFGPLLHDVADDSRGRIWLATDDGVRLYRSGAVVELTDVEGIAPTGPSRAVAVDRQGRVWIGGDTGLTLYDRERFVWTLDSTNSGLPSDRITALFVDSANRLWIGTEAGLARLEADRIRVFTTGDGLASNHVRAIDQLGSGEIVVSAADTAALDLFDGSTFTSLPPPPTAVAGIPISVDDAGHLWAERAMWLGGEWQSHFSTNSGLAFNSISHHASDGADRTWFAHGRSGGISVRGSFLPPLADAVPQISSVSQLSGSAGTYIDINGSNFGVNRDDVRVTIGAADARVSSVRPGAIRVELTENNTSGRIVVNVAGRETTSASTFCAVPVISHFTPTGGNAGMTVEVHGSNFDRGARLRFGAAAERTVSTTPSLIRTLILPTDLDGNVQVRNTDAGCNQSASSSVTFQRIGVSVERLLLNQGHMSQGLTLGKPTLVQGFLQTDRWLRAGTSYDDRVEIDEIELRFSTPGEPTQVAVIPHAEIPPTWPPSWPGASPPSTAPPLPLAWLQDIDMSLHATVTPWLQGGQPVEVEFIVRKGSNDLASIAAVHDFAPLQTLNVLLVPIMRNAYDASHLVDLRRLVDGGLDDARQRIFHFGRVNFHWSPTVYRADDMIPFFNEQVDVRDSYELFMASHNLERARRHWNGNSSNPPVTVAVGVVEAEASSNTGGGLAFWPDMSQLVNSLGLSSLDALCDFGDAVVEFFSLGFAGGDGCDIEVPLYVAWLQGSGDSSRLISHEVGHTLGLVRSHAANGSPTSNPSHSIFDEVGGDGTCRDIGDGSFYDASRTLYRSPGFRGPAVNPLTSQIFRPRLDLDTGHPRGKALMSYACQRGNRNVFMEPADFSHLRFELDPLVLEDVPRDAGTAAFARAEPVFVPGRRLLVSGTINRADTTGSFTRVEAIGEEGLLDISYATGHSLVQFDAEGIELARQGIFPVFRTSGADRHGHEFDEGFFAATILAAQGAARLELRSGDLVLDSLVAGPAAPTVVLSSPPGGGTYAAGEIPVSWTAADADGDPLEISVHYSPDNGASWQPVAFSSGSGSLGVPVAVLAGSTQARIRVSASDGFHTGSATSDAFAVPAQAPTAWIGAPSNGDVYLEGQRIRLSGGAWDAVSAVFPPAGLVWTSDRDGPLGTGPIVQTVLSVGTHQVRLEATNDAGLLDAATLTLKVLGDYDGDGLADADEPGRGLNPLWYHDAWFDEDGDGLPRITEINWGTDPLDPDTSGSGQSDGDDIAEGLDPLDPTDALPPDGLEITPTELLLYDDLSLGTLLPHEQMQILSRESVAWTVSSNRPWLRTLSDSGLTPDGLTVVADAQTLVDGEHSAALTFSSVLGEVVVPVTLVVEGSPIEFEVPLFEDRFELLSTTK